MNLPKPKSIDAWGGIKPYLNGTADIHNGLIYKDFKYRNRPRKHPQSVESRAEDFGVSKQTYYDWIKRDEAASTSTVRGKSADHPGDAASSVRSGGAGTGNHQSHPGDSPRAGEMLEDIECS